MGMDAWGSFLNGSGTVDDGNSHSFSVPGEGGRDWAGLQWVVEPLRQWWEFLGESRHTSPPPPPPFPSLSSLPFPPSLPSLLPLLSSSQKAGNEKEKKRKAKARANCKLGSCSWAKQASPAHLLSSCIHHLSLSLSSRLPTTCTPHTTLTGIGRDRHSAFRFGTVCSPCILFSSTPVYYLHLPVQSLLHPHHRSMPVQFFYTHPVVVFSASGFIYTIMPLLLLHLPCANLPTPYPHRTVHLTLPRRVIGFSPARVLHTHCLPPATTILPSSAFLPRSFTHHVPSTPHQPALHTHYHAFVLFTISHTHHHYLLRVPAGSFTCTNTVSAVSHLPHSSTTRSLGFCVLSSLGVLCLHLHTHTVVLHLGPAVLLHCHHDTFCTYTWAFNTHLPPRPCGFAWTFLPPTVACSVLVLLVGGWMGTRTLPLTCLAHTTFYYTATTRTCCHTTRPADYLPPPPGSVSATAAACLPARGATPAHYRFLPVPATLRHLCPGLPPPPAFSPPVPPPRISTLLHLTTRFRFGRSTTTFLGGHRCHSYLRITTAHHLPLPAFHIPPAGRSFLLHGFLPLVLQCHAASAAFFCCTHIALRGFVHHARLPTAHAAWTGLKFDSFLRFCCGCLPRVLPPSHRAVAFPTWDFCARLRRRFTTILCAAFLLTPFCWCVSLRRIFRYCTACLCLSHARRSPPLRTCCLLLPLRSLGAARTCASALHATHWDFRFCGDYARCAYFIHKLPAFCYYRGFVSVLPLRACTVHRATACSLHLQTTLRTSCSLHCCHCWVTACTALVAAPPPACCGFCHAFLRTVMPACLPPRFALRFCCVPPHRHTIPRSPPTAATAAFTCHTAACTTCHAVYYPPAILLLLRCTGVSATVTAQLVAVGWMFWTTHRCLCVRALRRCLARSSSCHGFACRY